MSGARAARGNGAAILIMLFAVGTFSVMDAMLKLLAPHYPPAQVASLRGLSSIPFVLAWVFASGGARTLLRVRWPLHLLRGLLSIAMMVGFVYALRRMPLSTAYTIFFVAPLLITALSVWVLKEHVGPRRWIAIGVGLLGVLIVMRPTGDGVLSLAGLAVLLAAFGYAVGAITVRVLSRTDSTQAIVFWMLVIMGGGAALIAWPDWRAITPMHWWLVAAIGLAGALGQWAVTEAFARGEASVIAPFEYSALAWGVALDLALWGVLPDGVTWIGAAVIVGSGLYLIHRERIAAKRPGK